MSGSNLIVYSAGSLVSFLVYLTVLIFAVVALTRQARPGFILIALACVLGLLAIAATFLCFQVFRAELGRTLLVVNIALQLVHALNLLLWGAGTILLFRDLTAKQA